MDDEVGRQPQYDAFADEFLEHAEDGFHNAHFDIRMIEETWSIGWHLRYWVEPLVATCDAIFQAGFLIERLLEPRPAPEAAAVDPAEYEKLSHEPRGFIAFRQVPRP
jgi:hypothetical protein